MPTQGSEPIQNIQLMPTKSYIALPPHALFMIGLLLLL